MEVVIYIYNGMTMLDAIGPYEVLRGLANTTIKLVALDNGEIYSDTKAVYLNAKYGLEDIDRTDILLIPGSVNSTEKEMKNSRLLSWIREIDQTTQWTTSVCSGSLILAASGVLKGLKATSHWKIVPWLRELGVVPSRQRVVREGKYLTAAGVSAGIDMAFLLASEIAGEEYTKVIQLMVEYDPMPLYNSGNYLAADRKIIELAEKFLSEESGKI